MFTNDEFKGKWNEIKGEIGKAWGELTGDEIDRTGGNGLSLIGLLQQKLGIKKEEAEQQLTQLAARWRERGNALAHNVSEKVNANIDSAKNDVKRN